MVYDRQSKSSSWTPTPRKSSFFPPSHIQTKTEAKKGSELVGNLPSKAQRDKIRRSLFGDIPEMTGAKAETAPTEAKEVQNPTQVSEEAASGEIQAKAETGLSQSQGYGVPSREVRNKIRRRLFGNLEPTPVQKHEEEGTSPPTSILQGEGSQVEAGGEEKGLAETEISLPIQAKLTIGEPNDKYEQEADRVARQVVDKIHSPTPETVQREEMGDEDEVRLKSDVGSGGKGEAGVGVTGVRMSPIAGVRVNRKVNSEGETQEASAQLEASIQGKRGSGQPLDESVKEPMEGAFGADFSGVRVHTDAKSDELNQAIQAKAFTTGEDIFFRDGAYEPGSKGGQELLAHELTHVVQQSGEAVQRGSLHPKPLQQAAEVLQCVTSEFPKIKESEYQPEFHNTSFLARVNLTPMAMVSNSKGNEQFNSSQLWVSDVKISNDRPPTKFGREGQRSHTVAWSLLRAAIQGLGGQPLNELIDMLEKMGAELQKPTNSKNAKNKNAKNAARSLNKTLKDGVTAIKNTTKLEEFSYWQLAASELVGKYVHAYQLSEEATYADGQAVGHGEPKYMAILRDAETLAKQGKDLTSNLSDIKAAAVGMLDVKTRLDSSVTNKILSHWINDLFLAFPILMSKHESDIKNELTTKGYKSTDPLKEVRDKSTTKSVEASGTPPEVALPMLNRSTFTANVVLTPNASGINRDVDLTQKDSGTQTNAQVSLAHYKIDKLDVAQLDVADDRPNTRFGVLQRSHTVAWTLVRRHLMHFKDKGAVSLANFVMNELTRLKTDIDSLEQNPKIGFDAPAQAEQKRQNLAQIVNNTDGFPLFRWQILLSELVETYVTLYQLSRSATYSKEERPKGHGESNAITTLQNTETQLVKGGIPDLDKYYADNKEDILEAAVKLVDATVATSSLKPDNWQIAIEHWLQLLDRLYPNVTQLNGFAEDIKAKISVMEPQEELLAGYQQPRNERDKVLINLYENAKQEVKSVPTVFLYDLYSSISLSLAEFVPPDYDKWIGVINGVKFTKNITNRWWTHIQEYGKPPNRNMKKDIPDENAFNELINNTKQDFQAVKNDRDKLIQFFAKKMGERAAKHDQTHNFIQGNLNDIKIALGKGIDEALELSQVGTIENYKDWFDLFNEIDQNKDVNYDTLLAAKKTKKVKTSD